VLCSCMPNGAASCCSPLWQLLATASHQVFQYPVFLPTCCHMLLPYCTGCSSPAAICLLCSATHRTSFDSKKHNKLEGNVSRVTSQQGGLIKSTYRAAAAAPGISAGPNRNSAGGGSVWCQSFKLVDRPAGQHQTASRQSGRQQQRPPKQSTPGCT